MFLMLHNRKHTANATDLYAHIKSCKYPETTEWKTYSDISDISLVLNGLHTQTREEKKGRRRIRTEISQPQSAKTSHKKDKF